MLKPTGARGSRCQKIGSVSRWVIYPALLPLSRPVCVGLGLEPCTPYRAAEACRVQGVI